MSFLFSFQVALAEDSLINEGLGLTAGAADLSTTTTGETGAENLAGFIGRVINIAFGAVAAIFITIILLGGLFWMFSHGNEEKVMKAKKFMLNGLFGLMVIFLGWTLSLVITLALKGAIGET